VGTGEGILECGSSTWIFSTPLNGSLIVLTALIFGLGDVMEQVGSGELTLKRTVLLCKWYITVILEVT
jgi:hypothetical protein